MTTVHLQHDLIVVFFLFRARTFRTLLFLVACALLLLCSLGIVGGFLHARRVLSPVLPPRPPHPFSSIFFLTTVLLAAQPALHVASGHTPGPTNALELESLCPNQRSGDIHFYSPSKAISFWSIGFVRKVDKLVTLTLLVFGLVYQCYLFPMGLALERFG